MKKSSNQPVVKISAQDVKQTNGGFQVKTGLTAGGVKQKVI